jgi:hypothetical protein
MSGLGIGDDTTVVCDPKGAMRGSRVVGAAVPRA